MTKKTWMFGTRMTATVVEIRPGGTVRLGFQAPKEVGIWREELVPSVEGEVDG